MNNGIRFGAPWCLAVKIVTVLVLAFVVGIAVLVPGAMPADTPNVVRLALLIVPLAIVAGTLPFLVRGYVVSERELLIERLGWANHIPLSTVISATADAEAIRGSIRVCGSSGLFGFFGWFRNRKLGIYRAYGTDPKLSVVVKLTNRTLVVTPDNPDRFVAEMNSRRKR